MIIGLGGNEVFTQFFCIQMKRKLDQQFRPILKKVDMDIYKLYIIGVASG